MTKFLLKLKKGFSHLIWRLFW